MNNECCYEDFDNFITLLTKHDSRHDTPLLCSQQFPDTSGDQTPWRYTFWPITEVEERFEKLARRNVSEKRTASIAINELGNNGNQLRRQRDCVKRIRAYVVDADIWMRTDVLEAVRKQTQPSFIVISSRKIKDDTKYYKAHFYYRIAPGSASHEEKVLTSYILIQTILARCVDNIIAKFTNQTPKSSKGWCDRSIFPEKAMRAPGFLHQKDPDNVFCAKLIECEGPDVSEETYGDFSERLGMTDDVVSACKKSMHRKTGGQAGDDGLIGPAEGVEEGNRHNYMRDCIWDLFFELRLNRVLAFGAAKELNEQLDPPLEDWEVESLFETAYDKWIDRTSEKEQRLVDSGNAVAIQRRFERIAEEVQAKKSNEDLTLTGPAAEIYDKVHSYDYSHAAYKFPLSDCSIMRRLYDTQKDKLIHIPGVGILTYDKVSGVWLTGGGYAKRNIESIVQNMEHEDEVKRVFTDENGNLMEEQLSNKITTTLNVNHTTSLRNSIRDMPEFDLDIDKLDSARNLIICPNGTIDLNVGKLVKHNPNHYFTKSLRAPLGSIDKYRHLESHRDWKSSLWLNFVHTLTEGNLEFARFIQVMFGYSMFGHVDEQKISMLLGWGKNGKSVLLDSTNHSFGSYGTSLAGDLFAASKFQKMDNRVMATLARLRGVRFAVCDEMNADQRLDEALVKACTNGQEIEARRLGKDPIVFKTQFNLFMQSNHKPIIDGADDGIWRRVQLLWFNHQVSETDRDLSLGEKFRTQHTEEITAWMVAGAVRYANEGLVIPSNVSSATAEYQREMLPLDAFLKECCIYYPAPNKCASVTEIHNAFKYWSYQNDNLKIPSLKGGAFGKTIKKAVCKVFNQVYSGKEYRKGDKRLVPLRIKPEYAEELGTPEVQQLIQGMRDNVVDMFKKRG